METEATGPEAAAGRQGGVFTQGSTMRHVLVMSSTGAVGLVAVFFVDVLNLLYISLLGQQELAAAVGYAATIMFFSLSASIGLTIASGAITARAFGAGDKQAAGHAATASLVFTIVFTVIFAAMLFLVLGPLLRLLGATGATGQLALHFMQIVVPSIPLLGVGMCCSGLLRAKGDARRAMYVTLVSGGAAAVIDPILIFGLDLGITGAAIAIVIVRGVMMAIGLHGVQVVHGMFARPDVARIRALWRPYFGIAMPAVLTQIATPVGNAWVTGAIARFGDDAVAGWAIVGRITPLAFAGIFALSGAVGPILSQNYGAGRPDRVEQAMRDSLIACAVYTCAMWALLAAASPWIVQAFGAKGDAADLVYFYCLLVAGSFIFNGALFVANAAFNNLGQPLLSTGFNWGRATLGVIPFVHVGMAWGPEGVLAGWGAGGVVFGIVAAIVCFRTLKRLPQRAARDGIAIAAPPSANSPFSTGKAALVAPPPPEG